jgi:uncharacterized protein YcgL (UPF0745 family)
MRAVRQLVLMDRARVAVGGAEKLGEALGIGRRAVNLKLNAERSLHNAEILKAADAVEERAKTLLALADDLRKSAQ